MTVTNAAIIIKRVNNDLLIILLDFLFTVVLFNCYEGDAWRFSVLLCVSMSPWLKISFSGCSGEELWTDDTRSCFLPKLLAKEFGWMEIRVRLH